MALSFIDSCRVTKVRKEHDSIVFEGALHPEICVGSLPFGGHILAVVISAVQETIKDTPLPDVIHLAAYFLKAGEVGPCEVRVRYIRHGKTFNNLEVQLIQKGATRLTAQFIVGILIEPQLDPISAPPLTLTPASPLYRRTPVGLHPSQAEAIQLPKFLRFRGGLRCAVDKLYDERNRQKAGGANDSSDINKNGVLEYGALLELTHPEDEVTAVTMPIFADMFRSTPVLLTAAEGRTSITEGAGFNWFPTMVLSIEFKHRLPRGPSVARNRVAIYSESRFLTAGRHEVMIEVWTTPPGVLGDARPPLESDWREKMVCLAVSTQMALTMSGLENTKRGNRSSQSTSKL
ncbi:thioesterase-like superfamily-domain-containing protein [Auriculariales sp. MPI-PUGE-AT-0066]|nr:thioesterase-like superfamily-domain-containing protein [Auriculariales sp. MPI-PUGE-AT-0066]